jgi:hypothetical protein
VEQVHDKRRNMKTSSQKIGRFERFVLNFVDINLDLSDPIRLRHEMAELEAIRSKDLYWISSVRSCMDYAFKRGFKPDLERIRKLLEERFSVEVRSEGDRLHLNYGALKSIVIWIENKRLNVVTQADPGASDAVILDTNKRYRDFLEDATGYTAKQRLQMAKKEVSKVEG